MGFLQTSAHTLSYAFIFLALYQDEQEKLYENIKSVLPDGRTPVSDSIAPSLLTWHSPLVMRISDVRRDGIPVIRHGVSLA